MAPAVDLRAELAGLLALQEYDERMRRLTEQRRTLARHEKALEAERQSREKHLQAAKAAHQSLQVDHRRKNSELLAAQEPLKRYQEQQKNARDAHEYTALGNQISRSLQQISALEEEVIRLLLALDESEAAVREETKRWDAYQEEHRREQKRAAATVRRVEAELEKTEKSRAAQADLIEPNALAEYETWRRRRGMTMVARVTGDVCGGCHMAVPPQTIIEARKFERRYSCPSCRRTLYVEDEHASEGGPVEAT
jgi:predicted  nucleic acid-binding Zn-ribbon protein